MFLEILSAEEKIFSGEVDSIIFPGSGGQFQILNNHAPIIKLAKWRNYNSSKYRLAMKILRIIPISLKPIIYILKTYLNISDKTRILYSYKIYRFLMIIIVINYYK